MRPRREAFLVAAVLALTVATPAHADFGVSSFTATVEGRPGQSGDPGRRASVHRASRTSRSTTPRQPEERQGHPRRPAARADLQPAGGTPTCTRRAVPVQLPARTRQVGTEDARRSGRSWSDRPDTTPIYNMETAAEHVSDFAFSIPLVAQRTDILGGVRDTATAGCSSRSATIPSLANLSRVQADVLGPCRGLRARSTDPRTAVARSTYEGAVPQPADGVRRAADDDADGHFVAARRRTPAT